MRAGDPAGLWAFGPDEKAVKACRIEGDSARPEETVAETSGTVDGMVATWSAEAGPTVAW